MSVAAVAALQAPARAEDRPATPAGAQALTALFAKFLPSQPSDAPPVVSVSPEGLAYLVTANLESLRTLFPSADSQARFEPASLRFKLAEQDDGNWRLAQDSFPKVVSHQGDATSSVELFNYNLTMLIDPKLAWWRSGQAQADRGVLVVHAPALDQTVDFGPLKADYSTSPSGDAVSTTVKEEIDDIGFKVNAVGKNENRNNVSGRVDKATLNLGAENLKPRKLYDLALLLNSHRGDLQDHQGELKALLKDLAEPGLKLVEGGEVSKILFSSPYGAVALSGAKAAVGLANLGPKSTIDVAVSANGLSLPVGLVPPAAADLTPTSVEVAATLKGFDIAAALNETIAAMRIGEHGAVLSDEDQAKAFQALLGPGPLVIDLAPSHVVAPAVDADLQGELRYAGDKFSGALTVRMRNVDKTMAAIQALGPDLASKTIPALAMAKGLAKTESDGSLSWVFELGEDRSMTVNGIPLGKAPN